MLVFIVMILLSCANQQSGAQQTVTQKSGNTQAQNTGGQQKYTPENYFKVRKIDNGKSIEIVEYTGKNTVVNIPPMIQKLPVTKIGKRSFIGNRKKIEEKLTSVIIPDSVIHIDNSAFDENKLTSVTIPDSVLYIGGDTFANNQLTSFTFGNSVSIIGYGAFANNQLTSITITDSVYYIDNGAFANNKLISVTIPNRVYSIGDSTFANNQLTSVTIGNSSTYIGRETFGSLRKYIIAYGAGTYTKEGNLVLRNGKAIQKEPATLISSEGVYFINIDGKKPASLKGEPHPISELKDTTIYSGTTYIEPGMHSVSVTYYRKKYFDTSVSTTWSKGSVTFEHRYLFEGGTYIFTANEVGDKIVYGIERKWDTEE